MQKLTLVLAVCALGCGSPEGDADRVAEVLALKGSATTGESLYTDNCAICHMESGKGDNDGGIGADLVQLLIDEPDGDHDFIGTIIDGEGDMTAFGDVLKNQEIADVLAYVHAEFGG